MHEGEIHIWAARLVAPPRLRSIFYDSLAPEEKKRAHAFHFEKHRNYFIIGRGLLRAILSWYTGTAPPQIELQYGANGKPSLVGDAPIHFNLAHSEDCVLFAFSCDSDLGVDVEVSRDLPGAESIAQRFFSAEEFSDLTSVPLAMRTVAFFNCWTRKEAYVKAVGEGLSIPLDQFRVSLRPQEPAVFLSLDRDTYPISQWTLRHLAPWEGVIGALAIPAPISALQERVFPDAEACLQFLAQHKS